MKEQIKKTLLFVTLAIPTSSLDRWIQLTYENIPANQVKIDAGKLAVKVNSSSSALIYKLPDVNKISGFRVDIEINGDMKLKESNTFEEDSYFRFGLVTAGERKIGLIDRFFGPQWLKTLHSLSPKGIERLYFFNVAVSAKQIDKSRQLPLSELMTEQVIAVKKMNPVILDYKLKSPMNVSAIWISSNGENSNSSFETKIRSIELR